MFVWFPWNTVPCLQQVLIQGKAGVPHLGRALTDVQELKQATCPKVQRSNMFDVLFYRIVKEWALVEISTSFIILVEFFPARLRLLEVCP